VVRIVYMSTRWRAAALLAVAALLGAMCASCDSEAVDNPNGVAMPATSVGPAKAKVTFVGDEFTTIRIEAEDADEIVSDDAAGEIEGKVMRVAEDEGASGGKCIWIPDLAGTPTPGKGKGPPKFARAVYKFRVEKAGLYTFWCRRKWLDNCADTFAMRFDREGQPRKAETEHIFGGSDSKPVRWAWSPVYLEGKPVQFFLTAGEHVLEVLNTEDGPKADLFLVTNDRDYVPQGMED